MRILVISFLFPNSIHPNRGTFVLNRMKAVHQKAEVKVINPIPWFPFQSRFERYKDYHLIPKKETLGGIEVYHPRFLSIPLVFRAVVAFTYCLAVTPVALRIRKTFKYDIVDLHWTFPDLPTGWFLSRLLRVKQVVTVRGEAALCVNERSVRRWIVNCFLKKADYVISLSERLRGLCTATGVSDDKSRTIQNGVDGTVFHYHDKKVCRTGLGIDGDEKVILAVGNLTPNKGFDRLIVALPEILKANPRTHLYLVGPDGTFAQQDYTAHLKILAKKMLLESHVHFVGEVCNRDLANWYGAADCFCLSSKSEGCPNVLLEALACGCPAVATNVGCVSEILVDEQLGQVVSNDAGGVREGISSAIASQYDRKQIAAHMQSHTWQKCAALVVSVFEELAAPLKKSPCDSAESPKLSDFSAVKNGTEK